MFNQCLFTSKQSVWNNTCTFCGLWCWCLMLNQCFWWWRQECRFSIIFGSAAVLIHLGVEENPTVDYSDGLHEWTMKLREEGQPSQQWTVLVFRHRIAKKGWHHLNISKRILHLQNIWVVLHIITQHSQYYNDITIYKLYKIHKLTKAGYDSWSLTELYA